MTAPAAPVTLAPPVTPVTPVTLPTTASVASSSPGCASAGSAADDGQSAIEALNSACFCISLDEAALRRALETEIGVPGIHALIRERCPTLFAARPVFLSRDHVDRMARVVRAVEAVVALPAWQQMALAAADPVARFDPGHPGVFFGYDFHLDGDRLGLIEINTNAGGALLNAALARAQRACCAEVEPWLPTHRAVDAFEDDIVEMFREEWRLAGRTRPLRSIAIVDDAPARQYLYPEFLLFAQLFERHGIRAVVADPAELELRGPSLWHGNAEIDLVYNRLTDFALQLPASATLRDAYLQRAVVLTPHPRAHALYADKRHLAVLGDDARLRELGAAPELRAALAGNVPRTEVVDAAQADRLWAARRGLFFKPATGFGSRAAYRGDKLTRRVWQEILAGEYVAQEIIAPGQRMVDDGDAVQPMKFDLRNYAYRGDVQWLAARLYQGQTTNFRTPGGGFAPVYSAASGAALPEDGYALRVGSGVAPTDAKTETLLRAARCALSAGSTAAPQW